MNISSITRHAWIRRRREELGLNQEELAARLQVEGVDVGRASVSNWETGRHEPNLGDPVFRTALAKSLKLSVRDVLRMSGYEISGLHTDEGERGAAIIDQLPEDRRELAIKILEQLL